MATLLTNQASDGAGTGQSHSGPCTVFVPNDSVFDGAVASVQAYSANTAGKFVPVGLPAKLKAPGAINIVIYGTYFLRGVVSRAGTNTSISMDSTQ